MGNRVTLQGIIVEQDKINPNNAVQNIALFGPDGKPLVLGGDISEGQFNHLKGRVTKIENRLKELEGGS